MSVSGWCWGLIILKSNRQPTHFAVSDPVLSVSTTLREPEKQGRVSITDEHFDKLKVLDNTHD